ncbi:MAG: hypothetical protein AAFY28_08255, partial [Actinomycetota bacterium]
MIGLGRTAAAGVLFGLASLAVSPVLAQGDISGPYLELDRYEVAPGDRVEVRIGGFESNAVT